MVLAGVNEGLLPFKPEEDGVSLQQDAMNLTRIQEERRLMYVGITRAQRSLVVSWSKRRKKGREMVNAMPSRFIAEMSLEQATTREDPREKLRALRAEFALKVEAEKALADKAEHKT